MTAKKSDRVWVLTAAWRTTGLTTPVIDPANLPDDMIERAELAYGASLAEAIGMKYAASRTRAMKRALKAALTVEGEGG